MKTNSCYVKSYLQSWHNWIHSGTDFPCDYCILHSGGENMVTPPSLRDVICRPHRFALETGKHYLETIISVSVEYCAVTVKVKSHSLHVCCDLAFSFLCFGNRSGCSFTVAHVSACACVNSCEPLFVKMLVPGMAITMSAFMLAVVQWFSQNVSFWCHLIWTMLKLYIRFCCL